MLERPSAGRSLLENRVSSLRRLSAKFLSKRPLRRDDFEFNRDVFDWGRLMSIVELRLIRKRPSCREVGAGGPAADVYPS